jgi:hypothetical protein
MCRRIAAIRTRNDYYLKESVAGPLFSIAFEDGKARASSNQMFVQWGKISASTSTAYPEPTLGSQESQNIRAF